MRSLARRGVVIRMGMLVSKDAKEREEDKQGQPVARSILLASYGPFK